MDSKEFRNLQEAYMEVVMNDLDEGAAGDVAARAQKLANQRKGQTPERKATYQGLADKAAQKARGQHAEEFELWVNSLVEEGYDLSDYTWDEMFDIYEAEKPFPYEKVTAQQKKHTDAGRYGNMMKMGLAKRRAKEAEKTGGSQQDAGKGWYHAKEEYVDEAITSEKGKAKAAEMIAKRTTASGRAKPGQGDNVATIKHIGRSNRDGLGGTPPNRKVAGSNWPKSYTGIGGSGNKAARRAGTYKEESEIFDAVLEYLVAEGYAETNKSAIAIMSNMSEEWRESIFNKLFE